MTDYTYCNLFLILTCKRNKPVIILLLRVYKSVDELRLKPKLGSIIVILSAEDQIIAGVNNTRIKTLGNTHKSPV